jgi:hypothetical protein
MMMNPNGNGKKMLVEIETAHPDMKAAGFNEEVKGYPILFYQYRQETGDCKKKCEESKDCGNYITYGNGKCAVDQTLDIDPIFSTTPPLAGELATENIPNIYTKKQIMSGTIFNSANAGNYSDYEISKDKYKRSASTAGEPNKISSVITERYKKYYEIMNDKKEGFSDIPPRFSNRLPDAPETTVEEGRIEDLQTIMFQQNVLYSVSSIAALSFLAGAIVLARN